MNAAQIDIRFPDGSVKQFPSGVTGMEIARGISPRLAKAALSIEVNGEIRDLARPIVVASSVRILKWEDGGGKLAYWHSSAHLMAEAVEAIFPGTKFGIGPPIENGFYYDIDMGDHRLTPGDLEAIEKRMGELATRDVPYSRREISWDEAVAYFSEKNDPYKLELLEGLKGQTITFYRQGNFTDLCYGPHIPSTGRIKAIKLLSVAGAYWRGDEKNKMLQRIYGITFPSDAELSVHVHRLEESKKRDHRKVGKELDLFVFHDVAPGAPFWLPKGMILFRELEKFLRSELDKRGYEEINTPILVKKDLWEQSGHWEHYRENMFCVEADDTIYSLKPMNCPESTYVYKHRLRSYKDLPLRFSEIGRLHRNEVSGALGGMFRVRQITMDDAHIYCRPDQILSEISQLIDLISEFYRVFGLRPVYHLSTRPENAMGEQHLWDMAEESLKNGLESRGLKYELKPGDGAFYGPKIDIQIEDAIGRAWQVATIQLDFVTPLDSAYLKGDPNSLFDLLVNLIRNAADAYQGGPGAVQLGLTREVTMLKLNREGQRHGAGAGADRRPGSVYRVGVGVVAGRPRHDVHGGVAGTAAARQRSGTLSSAATPLGPTLSCTSPASRSRPAATRLPAGRGTARRRCRRGRAGRPPHSPRGPTRRRA